MSYETFVGTLIGAILVFITGILLESYRRFNECQGVASAIAGEVFAIMQIAKKRRHEERFSDILSVLKSGNDVPIQNIIGSNDTKLDPVIDKYIDRIGLLYPKSGLPKKIVTFYTYLNGIRIDILRLFKGEFKTPQEKEFVIEEDLELWRDTVKLGEDILHELDAIAEKTWIFSCCWSKIKRTGLPHCVRNDGSPM